MKLYLLSGLGADERVFNYLELPGIEKVPIKWIQPNDNETITSYAKRLAEGLKNEGPINLLGVSFGGIIAQELTRHLKIRRLIIISSVKSSKELGLAFHLTRKLGVLKLLSLISPSKMKEGMSKMGPKLFGLKNKEEIDLFKAITADTNENFLRWAVGQIPKWEIPDYKGEIIHIHGTNDKMFPGNGIRDYIPIEKGGHFMIVNRAPEISKIVLEKIA